MLSSLDTPKAICRASRTHVPFFLHVLLVQRTTLTRFFSLKYIMPLRECHFTHRFAKFGTIALQNPAVPLVALSASLAMPVLEA